MVADATTNMSKGIVAQLETDEGSRGDDWHCPHQGGGFDAISGLYQFSNRNCSPSLGRWMQPDPAGYVDGANLYEYVQSSPTGWVDPAGLCAQTQPTASRSSTRPKWDPIAEEPIIRRIFEVPPRPMRGDKQYNWGTLRSKLSPRVSVRGPNNKVTPDEAKRWLEAVDRVLGTKKGQEWRRLLDEQNRTILVALTTTGKSHAQVEDTPVINIDEVRQTLVKVQFPFGIMSWVLCSPERAIAHELGHIIAGDRDDGPDHMNNIRRNETPVVTELGFGERIQYEGPNAKK